jgi:hypothetical protein
MDSSGRISGPGAARLLGLACACFGSAALAQDDSKKNPLMDVYFGEQHLHTQNSFDAFTVGVTGT